MSGTFLSSFRPPLLYSFRQPSSNCRFAQLFRRRVIAEVANAARVHVEIARPFERECRLDGHGKRRYLPTAVGAVEGAVSQQAILQPRVCFADSTLQPSLSCGVGIKT